MPELVLRVLREPLFSIGCSRVSSARGESYAGIFFEAVHLTVGFLVQDLKILLVSYGFTNDRRNLRLAPRSRPVGQRIRTWDPSESQGILKAI